MDSILDTKATIVFFAMQCTEHN